MDRGSMWMVGVHFHSAAGSAVRHFYLVDGAADGSEARTRAVGAIGCVPRLAGGHVGDVGTPWVEVQRVVEDPLGRVGLSAPLLAQEVS
ncbi:hypothetical protein ACFYXS_26530 [Streptomyces sp. NPDC002574]|uniref:hypothetical protein n=1 Tax=Streptomyces sp. NPDC002574 TaxID=3364652 RepID=UPI0036A30A80